MSENLENLNIPIEDAYLSTRSYNCLKRAGINYISELVTLSEEDLFAMPNVGAKSANEIFSFISNIRSGGLQLTSKKEEVAPKIFSVLDWDPVIENLDFSVRSYNGLKNSGIEYFSEVIDKSKEELEGIKGLGTGSIKEIFLKKATFSIVTPKEPENIDNIEKYLFSIKIAEDCENNYGIRKNIVLCLLAGIIRKNPEAEKETLIYLLYETKTLNETINEKIFRSIKENGDGIEPEQIYRLLPNHFFNTSIPQEILNEQERKKEIFEKDEKYFVKYLTAREYIESLSDEKYKKILSMRLEGKTLQECGDELGLTRERVRQITDKVLKIRPRLLEDKYIEIFEKYSFDKENFCFIFEETEETFNYLESVCNVRGKERLNIEEVINDDKVKTDIKKQVEKWMYRDSIIVDGVPLPKNRQFVFKYIVRKYCAEKTSYLKVVEYYNAFLDEYNVSDDPRLILESRTYENRAQTCDYILWNFNRNLRYYNIFENDYSEFVETLGLEKYKNVEMSSLKIFRDNEELMREYDIRDEFELHNLLKKIWDKYGNCEIDFHKMPTLVFGIPNKEKQVMDLLMMWAPISNDDFALVYEEEYGVKARTVLGNELSCIYKYLHNGIYSVDDKVFSDEQFEYMKANLTEDFYMLSEVERIFLRGFHGADLSLINAYNIKSLGFKVYSGYVVSDKYQSGKDFFRKMLTRGDIVDAREKKWCNSNIVLFGNVLYDLLESRTIVEFSPRQYINIHRLNEVGVTKEMLCDYCKKVFDYSEDEEFFTIKSLRKRGFEHEIDELGFDDWFYASLLSSDSEKFSYRRMGGRKLFACGKRDIQIGFLLEHIVNEKRKIGIEDLELYLDEKYGIKIDRYKLAEIIKGTDLYYDSIMETVYCDYDTYFEEV